MVEYIEDGSSNKSNMVVVANDCSSTPTPLFPSLIELSLLDIPGLKGWCGVADFTQDQSQNQLAQRMPAFPKLGEVEMNMELVYSLGQGFLQGISSLHTLGVMGKNKVVAKQTCGLTNVPAKQRQPIILLHSYLPMLRSLSFIDNQMEHLSEEIRGMSSLESLGIHGCEALESIPEWIDSLTSLQRLTITNCPRLKSLPDEMSNLSNLKSLTFIECSREIAERCKEPSGEDWHKIKHIPCIFIAP